MFKQHQYDKGMYMDSHISVQPEQTYPYAKNIINRDQYQNNFISNEHSDTFLIDTPHDIISYVYQEEYDRTIYLLKDQSLYYQDHKTETFNFICKAEEFDCTWELNDCEKSDMKVYTKGCDSYVQWSSSMIYYIVNISEMLDINRKKSLILELTGDTCKGCNKDCNYFKVFKPKCNTLITARPNQKGGSLSAGTYIYTSRLKNSDGNVTNYTLPSKPIYIYSQHNVPGEDSSGKVDVEFKHLDCNYTEIEIAVTYFSGSSVITRILPSQYFSGDTFSYTHIETNIGDPIDISEILSLSSINLNGKKQFDYNGKMYYYAIKPELEFNIQSIANKVKTSFYTEKYSLETMKKYQIKTFPRGETVAFGLWLNNDDGTKTFAGNIPNTNCIADSLPQENSGSGGGSGSSGIVGDDIIGSDNVTFDKITEIQPQQYIRSRDPQDKVDSVSDPIGADELLDIEKQLVDSYTTDISDLSDAIRPVLDPNNLVGQPVGLGLKHPSDCCDDPKDELNQFSNVKNGHKNADLIDKDLTTAESIAVKWGSILGDLIGEEGKKDLIKTFTPSNIKQLSQDIINAVKRREVIVIKDRKYSVDKTSIDYNKDSFGKKETTRLSEYPGGQFLTYYDSLCKPEKDTVYPCVLDCNGNPIWGELTGKPVVHHTIPTEDVIDYYESKSIGVPSKLTPDADEYSDGYGIVIGVEFSGINIDKDAYTKSTGKRICNNNPYTIGQVKLTDANKTILTKGATLGNYVASNQGKEGVYQNLGVNSFEKCDKYIDIDGNRSNPNARAHNSVCMYSLDQSAIEPFVGGAQYMTWYRRIYGEGYRHNLYADGIDPSNKLNGRRIDIKGTVQSVNLSQQTKILSTNVVDFAKYVNANTTEAPDYGGDLPLVNKYQQECLWINGSARINIKDKSFVGDVLNHSAPITHAETYYGVLYRVLDNQYGALENLSYIPILQGKRDSTSVKGLAGNRFISPYSFVKTSFVSDKVGNKFPISIVNPSKSDRCICDNPDDAVNDLVGKYFWTQLPKDSDESDAKNWCGLHTPMSNNIVVGASRAWSDANTQTRTESDMYYPGTLTTMITYWGEWETNPWGVELSDNLEKQRYPFIKETFELGSNIPEKHPWDISYLDQFHIKVKQPSLAEKTLKVLIKSFVNLVVVAWGLEDLLSPDNGAEFLGDISGMTLVMASWALLSKVLFSNEFIDDFLNIPACKQQSEGGIDFTIESFFRNWNQYSSVFNRELDIIQIQAYRGEDSCCDFDSIINKIYASDPQIEESMYNGFTYVRPNNFVTLSANKGAITDMFEMNGGLYANTTDGMFSLIVPRVEIQTNNLPIISGQGNILNPQLIVGSNPEGYAGLISSNHAINCQLGRFQLDYEAGIVYYFVGKGLEPISMNGAYNFFKKHTKYCNESECSNEQVDQYYALGYDPHLQRILITKYDIDEESSWTISYDPIKKVWISFHSYFPNNYLNTRKSIYHLTKNKIYIHDNKSYSYGEYLDQEPQESIIDTKTIGNYMYYSSHIIDSDAHFIKDNTRLYNQKNTFNSIGFFGSNTTAGINELVPYLEEEANLNDRLSDNVDAIPASFNKDNWNINELHNYTINPTKPIVSKSSICSYEDILINAKDYSDLGVENASSRNLASKWFITRLIFENKIPNLKLYLRSLTLLIEEKSE